MTTRTPLPTEQACLEAIAAAAMSLVWVAAEFQRTNAGGGAA